jgi:hypothetical protein
MKPCSRRSRLVRLTAGGLLLSALSPLAIADLPAPPAVVGSCPGGPTDGQADRFLDRPNHDPCATIPRGAIPMPAGTAVNAWEGLMARKAAADRFVIYLHEWYMGGVALGPYGCSHLQRIAAALSCEPAFVVLEPDLSPEVNENRRLRIVTMLQSVGVADAERRVVTAFPTAEGMWGLEAAMAFNRGHSLTGGAGGGAPVSNLGGYTPFGGGQGFMQFGGFQSGVRIGGY